MKEDIALKKIERIRSLVKRLKSGSLEYFQRTGLNELNNKLLASHDLLSPLSGILPTIPDKLKSSIEIEKKRGSGPEDAWLLGALNSMESDAEQAALRWYALQETQKTNLGNGSSLFTINSWSYSISSEGNTRTNWERVQEFFSSCIEPLIDYIEESLDGEIQLLTAFERYKVLCEWYDRKSLSEMKELEMTQEHLTKFLFHEGFTYNLTEVHSPSGRSDNMIPSSDAMIAEAKIFKNEKSIKDVCSQIEKRMEDFNLPIGYCVIYCQDENIGVPKFLDADGNEGPFVIYRTANGKRIAIMTVRLFDIPSTETIGSTDIRLK